MGEPKLTDGMAALSDSQFFRMMGVTPNDVDKLPGWVKGIVGNRSPFNPPPLPPPKTGSRFYTSNNTTHSYNHPYITHPLRHTIIHLISTLLNLSTQSYIISINTTHPSLSRRCFRSTKSNRKCDYR